MQMPDIGKTKWHWASARPAANTGGVLVFGSGQPGSDRFSMQAVIGGRALTDGGDCRLRDCGDSQIDRARFGGRLLCKRKVTNRGSPIT